MKKKRCRSQLFIQRFFFSSSSLLNCTRATKKWNFSLYVTHGNISFNIFELNISFPRTNIFYEFRQTLCSGWAIIKKETKCICAHFNASYKWGTQLLRCTSLINNGFVVSVFFFLSFSLFVAQCRGHFWFALFTYWDGFHCNLTHCAKQNI